MLQSFEQGNIDNRTVKWILHPNKDEITDEFANRLLIPGNSFTCGKPINAYTYCTKGLISCTYKHYLALKDIIDNGHEYAVIMEDNMQLGENMSSRVELYIQQLNHLYPDWDILFDNDGFNPPYNESEIKEHIYVYPKSNEITDIHGSTKAACFYLLNLKCAQKLYEYYIPFNNSPDWWMNDLFRKLNIKSFWAIPGNVSAWNHVSTCKQYAQK
jgi:GR25 family glycosyltransferase involved in LPS biosynthesis